VPNSHCFRLLSSFLLFAFSAGGLAHQGSTSYLTLAVDEDRVRGRWEIPLADLELALKLDKDSDHKVSLGELQARYAEVKAYALQHLKLSADAAAQTIQITNANPVIQVFADGASTALDFIVTNLARPKILEVEYRFMFDHKPLDRAFMQVECRGVTQTAVFTSDRPVQRFNLEVRHASNEFLSFGWHGVWHIWIGLDHILFLMALLLPAVLKFDENHWRSVGSFREAFFNVFKVVTAFTLAHSLTLSLAALQIVVLPSRWVESAIAASVLAAAVNNIHVLFRRRLWVVAFVFGLIHGFGFANVLSELGLPRNALLLALVGFNLGVEAGQLAIVGLFLPLAYAMRRSTFYQNGVMKFGSVLIAVLAGLWLVERVFDWKILPM
jgi:hypothetical protein